VGQAEPAALVGGLVVVDEVGLVEGEEGGEDLAEEGPAAHLGHNKLKAVWEVLEVILPNAKTDRAERHRATRNGLKAVQAVKDSVVRNDLSSLRFRCEREIRNQNVATTTIERYI